MCRYVLDIYFSEYSKFCLFNFLESELACAKYPLLSKDEVAFVCDVCLTHHRHHL
jgi:hypothetical protein